MRSLDILKDAWKNRHTLGDKQQAEGLNAFLPAALEIQATPPNPLSRWLAWSLIALVLIGILWACFGQVNIVASAEGKIIPSSRVKQIQPLEKGVVKTILVSEGDDVQKGQALIELETTRTLADQNRLQREWQSTQLKLIVQQNLLQHMEHSAEQANTTPSLMPTQTLMPDWVTTEDAQLHRQLLQQQWRHYWAQTQSLHSSLRKTQAEQAVSQAIIEKLEQTLPIATERANKLKNLHAQQFVSETDYLEAEQVRIQQQQDLAAERQRLQQKREAESEVREQIHTHVAQTKTTWLTEIAEQQRQIAALEEELIKATDLYNKQILYAPVSGRVQDLAVHTVGGVVTEAQPLMTIVPDEEHLEVEVFLENKDIGFVQENMSAEIKVHTFPFTKYGVIDATVSKVSHDATVDEQRGLIYSLTLQLAKNTLRVNKKDIKLMPGMAVTAEVQTGHRRMVEFFLAPLLRAKAESIRER